MEHAEQPRKDCADFFTHVTTSTDTLSLFGADAERLTAPQSVITLNRRGCTLWEEESGSLHVCAERQLS